MPDPTEEALREVRARLDEAHAAADRLVHEATRQAGEEAPQPVPPRGWDSDRREPPRRSDFQALAALLESVRDAVPAEVSRQLATALRELLLALRALIDWYLELLDRPARERPGVEVEDIPLD